MMKWILALAVVGVLAAGHALATSSPNVGATTFVNGPLVQVGPALTVELPAAEGASQEAPAAVEGHATGLGSSTPQPFVERSSAEPAVPAGAPLGPRPPCPTGHHLGIACAAP